MSVKVITEAMNSGMITKESTAFLICGDFNIDSIKDWRRVQKYIIDEIFHNKARELHREFQQKNGKGDIPTFDKTENSLVVWPQRDRLDYCFAIDLIFTQDNTEVKLMKVSCDDMKVLKQSKGEEWSDHWGQVFTISPKS